MEKNTVMTQPTKKGNIDTQVEKIMVLLEQINKATELKATVRFRNILNVLYEGEVDKLEVMITKQEKTPSTCGNTKNTKEEAE